MTRIIFMLLTLGIGVTAHADISDSGNLTIGGTGVIQGTMTVQGSAFSVGGSTFAVLGGTAQVGGLLRVSSLGIQWNDGTTSTTSSSGGGSTTNEWQWVGDTVAVNDVSVGFSNLTSSVAYRIEIDIVGNGSTGRLFVQFNGDTGNNYRYGYQGEVDNNSNGASGGSGQPDIALCLDSGPLSGGYHGSFDFASVYGSPKTVIASARWTYLWSSNYITGYSGGAYVGSASLSSVKVGIGSSRTFSGVVKLFKRNGTAW